MQEDWTLAESETIEGLRVEVRVEEYVDSCMSPREWTQIGTMVCWHPDYTLGDFQVTDGDNRGAVETPFERNDFRSMRALYRYIGIALGGRCIMPLYLYDHSGISISVGEPNPFDNPTVRRDAFGNGLGWDTSMVGFIYASETQISECCGEGAEYRTDEFLSEALRGEVHEYDAFLRGEVYFWRVVDDATGEPCEDGSAVGGYVGEDGRKSALADGIEFAQIEARERVERAEVEAVERGARREHGRRDGMCMTQRVVVLNDGETFSDISGCVILDLPDDIRVGNDVDEYVKENAFWGVPVEYPIGRTTGGPGRIARAFVTLDETEHPTTIHEVAQIILSATDRPLAADEILNVDDNGKANEGRDCLHDARLAPEIVVYLDGGMLAGYEGLPDGYKLVLRDSDVDAVEAELNGRSVVEVDGVLYEEVRP